MKDDLLQRRVYRTSATSLFKLSKLELGDTYKIEFEASEVYFVEQTK
ncbi:31785_t:CDS:2 [Gigaspora margarita]|uniref:31785_t:CDS:1 n=1 Tax=Gigaspora margarita TaxID=4874 RepID=A0ABN7V1Y8_GIGMA|nr:31785_t:CDS:2 [Gigaspora margarita]